MAIFPLACKEMATRVKKFFDLDGFSSLLVSLADYANGTVSMGI